MPRKPNYKFERMERDRAKAARKAERLKAKQERAELRKAEQGGELTTAEPGLDEHAGIEEIGLEETDAAEVAAKE